MKVLIVHDRMEVAKEVAAVVRGALKDDAVITLVEDCVQARERLRVDIYDLLIIDLTLPYMKGQPINYTNVEQLLTELIDLDTMVMPGDVIGMTFDEEALCKVKSSIGAHLMALIEETSDESWKEKLTDKIYYTSRAAHSRQIVANRHYVYDVLIVTALDKEQRPYDDLFPAQEVQYYPGAKQFLFRDAQGKERRGVRYSIGSSGQASSASTTQSLISYFRPRFAFMSGYCGGVKDKVQLGDLVFFDASYDWDYGKWYDERPGTADALLRLVKNAPSGAQTDTEFRARPNPVLLQKDSMHWAVRNLLSSDFRNRAEVKETIKKISGKSIDCFNVEFCPAASGSAVVADQRISTKIRTLNDNIKAVDMESYGFYYACEHTHVVRPEFICIKAVSDFCDGEKGDSLHEVCSSLSAVAVHEMLTTRLQFRGP